jgi:hypothetical protein
VASKWRARRIINTLSQGEGQQKSGGLERSMEQRMRDLESRLALCEEGQQVPLTPRGVHGVGTTSGV